MRKLMRYFTSALMAAVVTAAGLPFSGALFALAAQSETNDVRLISTAAELMSIAENPQGNYMLTDDIDLSNAADLTPIGTESNPFSGVFNGAGHTVTLGINRTDTKNGVYTVGLFGNITGTVSNLRTDGKITAEIYSGYVGAVAANLAGGTILDCVNDATMTIRGTGIVHVGGLVGAVRSGFMAASVKNCVNNGSMSVKAQNLSKGSGDLGDGTSGTVGCVVGFSCTAAEVNIENCINNADLNIDGGNSNIGGILGMTSSNNNNSKANITYCANKGNVTVINLQGERAAGIVGYIKNGVIDYCYNTGNVLAYSDNGVTLSRIGYGTHFGIFGYANINANAPLEVKYCYNASAVPLEAEICLIRNAKYGTFKNFYMHGREEYELELKGESGNAGTAFTSADDLMQKLAAQSESASAYEKNPDGGYPVLFYEAPKQLPDSEYSGDIKAEILGNRLQNLYFVLQTSNKDLSNTVITANLFKDGKQVAKIPLEVVESVKAGAEEYKAANGSSLYGATLFSNAVIWTQAVITVEKDGGAVYTKSIDIDNSDVAQSVKIPFDGFPDYPEGSVSKIYNAGPGLAVDETSVTSEDSEMVVVSGTYRDTFDDYIKALSENGFKKLSESSFEGNLHYAFEYSGQNYYIYYTAYSKTVRIIKENSSTVSPDELDPDPIGTGKTEVYLYSIDYTLGDGQTSHTNYWSVDCGACLVVKLADNSVFIIDGGHQRQSSKTAQESFLDFLYKITGKDKSAGDKIRIKGWFFSHAHDDHTYFSEALVKSCHEYISIDNLLFNFPSYQTIKGGYATSVFGTRRVLKQYYPDCGVIKLHAGQQFSIQGVNFDVLYTHEDAVSNTGLTTITDFNSSSTVFKMTVDGKSFMMLGDSSDKASEIMLKKYTSETLKSDCVQVAHHNYNYLPDLYKAIGAKLAMLCNSEVNAGYNSGNRQKYLAVIEAAQDVKSLFAYPDTYKIMVENNELAYQSVPGYRSAFKILKPPSLSSKLLTGKAGFKENTEYVIKNKTSLADKIIDRSVISTAASATDQTGYLLFDGNYGTRFSSNSKTAGVVWTMKEPSVVDSYILYTSNDAASTSKCNPKSWILCGSNDGESWTVVDSVSDARLPKAGSRGTAFKADNPGEYLYYTIRFFATEGSTPLKASELALYSGVTDPAQSVSDRIDNLPDTITLSDESEISDIRSAFEKLSDEQKAQVKNEDVLKRAEAALAALNPAPPTPTPTPNPKPSVPKNGTKVINSKTVLYQNSKAVSGTKVVTVGGKTYAVVKGFVKTGTKTQLVKIGKKTYVVDKSGVVVKAKANKLIKIGSKSYILSKNGTIVKGNKNKLIKVGKKSYIVNKSGIVLKNKKSVKVGKKTYKINKKGIATKKK